MTGYDPDRAAGDSSAGRDEEKELDSIIVPYEPAFEVLDSPFPPPLDVDPRMFFRVEVKKPLFQPELLAKYLMAYLSPITFTAEAWWKYQHGVWTDFPESSIFQAAVVAMKNKLRIGNVKEAIDGLKGMVNKEWWNWYTDPGFVNCLSGMIELKTGEIFPHDPKYGSRCQVKCNYDWANLEKTDRWLDFGQEVYPEPGNTKFIILQKYFGYCLLPDSRFQKALFLVGDGANGKSRIVDILVDIIGEENASSLDMDDLAEKFNISMMEGKMINVATEIETKKPAATNTFKKASSGDLVKAERKYGIPYQFRPYCKFIFTMNTPPMITDKSHGFMRRPIVLQHNRRFEEGAPDTDENLMAKLIEEKDGIFMWMLAGLGYLLKDHGFKVGEDVKKDTRNFMANLNPLLIYIEENCDIGEKYMMSSKDLYEDYQDWCKKHGHSAISMTLLYRQLKQHFNVEKRIQGKRRTSKLIGIQLAPEVIGDAG